MQADVECMKRAEPPWPPSFLVHPVLCCLCRLYAVEATSDCTREDKLDHPSCGDAEAGRRGSRAEATTAVVFGAWDCGQVKVFELNVTA